MIHFFKKEKKHFFVFSLLVLLLSFLILSTFRFPLLAATAYCKDGECTCSCSGSNCWCNAGNNSCECACYPDAYDYCINGLNPLPEPD